MFIEAKKRVNVLKRDIFERTVKHGRKHEA